MRWGSDRVGSSGWARSEWSWNTSNDESRRPDVAGIMRCPLGGKDDAPLPLSLVEVEAVSSPLTVSRPLAPDRIAPSRSASLMSAPVRSAPEKSTADRSALLSFLRPAAPGEMREHQDRLREVRVARPLVREVARFEDVLVGRHQRAGPRPCFKRIKVRLRRVGAAEIRSRRSRLHPHARHVGTCKARSVGQPAVLIGVYGRAQDGRAGEGSAPDRSALMSTARV